MTPLDFCPDSTGSPCPEGGTVRPADVREWLRAHGPVTAAAVAEAYGIRAGAAVSMLLHARGVRREWTGAVCLWRAR